MRTNASTTKKFQPIKSSKVNYNNEDIGMEGNSPVRKATIADKLKMK